MRRVVAFILALAVYLLAGAAVWWIGYRSEALTEALQATEVTLVSLEESFEEARQQVNAEASEAAAEETPPQSDESEPKRPEEEAPEPQSQPPQPTVSEPEPEPTKPPQETPDYQEVMPEDLEDPEPPDLLKPQPDPLPRLQPPDPIEAEKFLALKSCPAPHKVKKSRLKQKKRLHHTQPKRDHRASRASSRSRARRGGGAAVNRLLARIKRRIARNKSYPRTARRRRAQGSVRVSFTITRGGGVRGIRCQGPALFCPSAQSAVRRAFPVSVEGASSSLPRRMSVTLSYRLR
ncbi:TonB family protein [Nitratifractor sp.]